MYHNQVHKLLCVEALAQLCQYLWLSGSTLIICLISRRRVIKSQSDTKSIVSKYTNAPTSVSMSKVKYCLNIG